MANTIQFRKLHLKKKKKKKKSTHDAIQMHTENSLFRISENQILQGLPIWQFSVGWNERKHIFVEECCWLSEGFIEE